MLSESWQDPLDDFYSVMKNNNLQPGVANPKSQLTVAEFAS